MNSWRDAILSEFVPNINRLTIVTDPDALLSEEKLATELRNRGFDLIEFNNAIEFRYAYELNYRSIWDKGKGTDLVVILRLHNEEMSHLPYDLVERGKLLSFNLGELFPNLSYPVIELLDRSFLDILFSAQKNYSPGRLGDNATKDFILRHVFGIAAELINSDVDLLRSLLRIHYSELDIPDSFSHRLVSLLKDSNVFNNWPLDVIIPDKESFFAFLQERWPIFLNKDSANECIKESSEGFNLKYFGSSVIPFDHHDIRIYIDNLFVEGKLKPVKNNGNIVEAKSWIASGIVDNEKDNIKLRISRLFDLIKNSVPDEDCRHSEWIALAMKWAELSSIIHTGSFECEHGNYIKLGSKLNMVFLQWIENHYASLINLPPTNPVMLHHVVRRVARELETKPHGRIALIVIDGLSMDQWVNIRKTLKKDNQTFLMRESAVFAWIPTLTSVSRQAIFAGKAPLYFPNSINNTNNESALWRQSWEEFNLTKFDISYLRGLGDGNPIDAIEDIFNPDHTKVIGMVIDKVDKIMHGMQLGSAGMHNQIRQWCEQGYLMSLINCLLNKDFEIWITSDHGNIESTGKGRPKEGSIAEIRGERARIYSSRELRTRVHQEHKFAIEWEPAGLPANYYPLLAEERGAFVKQSGSIVGHGGVSIEEVIVPLVKIERVNN